VVGRLSRPVPKLLKLILKEKTLSQVFLRTLCCQLAAVGETSEHVESFFGVRAKNRGGHLCSERAFVFAQAIARRQTKAGKLLLDFTTGGRGGERALLAI
jgi:hypothetical protein